MSPRAATSATTNIQAGKAGRAVWEGHHGGANSNFRQSLTPAHAFSIKHQPNQNLSNETAPSESRTREKRSSLEGCQRLFQEEEEEFPRQVVDGDLTDPAQPRLSVRCDTHQFDRSDSSLSNQTEDTLFAQLERPRSQAEGYREDFDETNVRGFPILGFETAFGAESFNLHVTTKSTASADSPRALEVTRFNRNNSHDVPTFAADAATASFCRHPARQSQDSWLQTPRLTSSDPVSVTKSVLEVSQELNPPPKNLVAPLNEDLSKPGKVRKPSLRGSPKPHPPHPGDSPEGKPSGSQSAERRVTSDPMLRNRTRRSSQLFTAVATGLRNLLGGDSSAETPMRVSSSSSRLKVFPTMGLAAARRHSISTTGPPPSEEKSSAVAQLADYLEDIRRIKEVAVKLAMSEYNETSDGDHPAVNRHQERPEWIVKESTMDVQHVPQPLRPPEPYGSRSHHTAPPPCPITHNFFVPKPETTPTMLRRKTSLHVSPVSAKSPSTRETPQPSSAWTPTLFSADMGPIQPIKPSVSESQPMNLSVSDRQPSPPPTPPRTKVCRAVESPTDQSMLEDGTQTYCKLLIDASTQTDITRLDRMDKGLQIGLENSLPAVGVQTELGFG